MLEPSGRAAGRGTRSAGEVPGPPGYPFVGALPKMRRDLLRYDEHMETALAFSGRGE